MILLLLATANLGGRRRLKNYYLVYGKVTYRPLITLVLDQQVLDLKTFGGRASGPEPLKRLFDFVTESFINAKGRKLTSLEVHDITCYDW